MSGSHTSARRSLATVLVPLGVAMTLAAFLSYGVTWRELFAVHPQALSIMKRVVRYLLAASTYVGMSVPVLVVVGSLYRFVVARGSRGLVFVKLTSYVFLWALGSSALVGALFVAYLFGEEHAAVELLVPATLGVVGYFLIGVGLVASVFRGAPSRRA